MQCRLFLIRTPFSTCARVAQITPARPLFGLRCRKRRPCISISRLIWALPPLWFLLAVAQDAGVVPRPSSWLRNYLCPPPRFSVRTSPIMFVWPPACFFLFVYLDSPAALYLSISARDPSPSLPRLCLALKLPSTPSHLPSHPRGDKDVVAARPKQEVLLSSVTHVCCVLAIGCSLLLFLVMHRFLSHLSAWKTVASKQV